MSYFGLWVCSVSLVVACTPTLAANKCTGSDGKISFQDTPCVGKGEALNIRSTAINPSSGSASLIDWKAKAAESDKRLAIQASMERGEPVIGMTLEQLEQTMGLPDRINTGDYQSGSKDQRIYDRNGLTWYVYNTGSLVTAVQTTAAVGAASKPSTCPSSLEIRNAATSASSNTIPEGVRVEMMRQIRDMKNCGR